MRLPFRLNPADGGIEYDQIVFRGRLLEEVRAEDVHANALVLSVFPRAGEGRIRDVGRIDVRAGLREGDRDIAGSRSHVERAPLAIPKGDLRQADRVLMDRADPGAFDEPHVGQ